MGNNLTLPYGGTTSSANPAFSIINTAPNTGPNSGAALQAESFNGNGVVGLSGAFGGAIQGDGVYGLGKNGVHGESGSATDSGVWGNNKGTGYGVYGSSVNGTAVYGISQNGLAGHFQGKVRCEDSVLCLSGLTTNGPVTHIAPVTAHGITCAAIVCDGVVCNGDITAHDVMLPGGDCAEDFPAVQTENCEAGSVVVARDADGALEPCQVPYDRRVIGVVSGAGTYRPGIVLDRQETEEPRVTVALIGKVYCRVDARLSEIAVGDLLTTSATPGHAMKATDEVRAFGAIIGKALRPLAGEAGLIPILVALQ